MYRLAAALPLTSRAGFAERVDRREEARFRLLELEAAFFDFERRFDDALRVRVENTVARVCRTAGVICPQPCCAICCAIHWLLLVGFADRDHAHAQRAA